MWPIQHFIDVVQYVRRFGAFIYTGDRLADIELIHGELRELFQLGMMDADEYAKAVALLKQEEQVEKKKKLPK
ncbi:YqgQ family protein [Aureibacillus halotolerans]|uniref:Uncharacterized protein YqgQ n=1 Tax=Aureibacillus halotolerans TaxID=1508390 RepID=A0A4R6U9M9_9BACI|nr:YqgQ family protein [Aureibacillus halotolerans]TDQ41693.1 uncharacterized protein YqgQ [Aureibacillus halotolerans]